MSEERIDWEAVRREAEARRAREVSCEGMGAYGCWGFVDPERAPRCCGGHWCEDCYRQHTEEMCHF